jgi:hypothetical protein
MEEYQAKLNELRGQHHFVADGNELFCGQWYWNNDLKACQVTEMCRRWNAYADTDAIQVWHATLDPEGHTNSFDTLTGELARIGRLTKYWEGLPAQIDGVPQMLAPRDCECGEAKRHTHPAIKQPDPSAVTCLEDLGLRWPTGK